ncbi:MAG: class I SAM-dependent methyltransferase [Acidobacteria bacterium]|nr:class I SAM-dependent methyltransferase [Acidobacteriota bacterium]MBI3425599.1 class I SAM-dependent methyltransferase [Acidobacteriota bacterium]
MTEIITTLEACLGAALSARAGLFEERHQTAFRLFNGFSEGWPALVADLYAQTLVLHDYAERPETASAAVRQAQQFYQARLPWLRAIVLKQRNAESAEARNGRLLYGTQPCRKVREHGVWYALDVRLNQDAGFYLDTRNVREWALRNVRGKSVLNTFAYTGSLGIAARAGGAARVVQLDLKREFLNVAKTSCMLNGFSIDRRDFLAGDFWPLISRLNREKTRFDGVFLDPPFFAATAKGVVDTENNFARLINKVRPLINDGGWLVAINNALYVSGGEYLRVLQALCADGYLAVEELLTVPLDCAGYETARTASTVTDPAPFNHATKIAVLRVRRKAAGSFSDTELAMREPSLRV